MPHTRCRDALEVPRTPPSGGGLERRGSRTGRFAGRLRGPFGDVGVRLGGSELHQGSAPALRLRHHFGGRRTPSPRLRSRRMSSGPLGVRAAASAAGRSGQLADLFGDPRARGLGLRPSAAPASATASARAGAPASATASARAGAMCQPRPRPRRAQARVAAPATAGAARLRPGSPDAKSVRQRQEGNGRSDAVRLLMRGTLRRVRFAARERRWPLQATPRGCSWEPELETRRTPESSAGCNKPAAPVRRKPSRW